MGKKVEIEKIYSLSPMQQGMLFHWLVQKESGTDAYYRQSVFTVTGAIDLPVFEKSIACLIDRYEVLRTVFVYDKIQKPKQVVLKKIEAAVNFEDITHLSRDNGEQQRYLEEYREKDLQEGFDLTKGLLMRISLFKTAEACCTLVWSYHHIIMDGWCLGILFGDLIGIYQNLAKGEPLDLEPVVPYRNYIKWLESRDLEEGLKYWAEYLEGYEQQASLPRLGRGAGDGEYQLQEYEWVMGEEQSGRLMQLAAESRVTVNTLCQVLWGILLQRCNNTCDVVFGATVSGRPAEVPGIEGMVGLFINTIPVRIRVEEGQNFSGLLRWVQEKSVFSRDHEYLPLAEIQAASPLKGDLIDHLMVFENYPMQENLREANKKKGPGFSVDTFESLTRTNYDFNILITFAKTLSLVFNFNAALYERDFIKKIAGQFKRVVKQVIDDPHIDVKGIRIISEKDRQQLLYAFNSPPVPYPENKTIHELFEDQVEKTPGSIAVTGEKQLTYKELNEQSNQLAGILREKGALAGSIAGIMLERSIEVVIGILAILKAGGAYLPIDPDYPEERINYMLADSGAKILLKKSEIRISKSETNTNDQNSNDRNTINAPIVLNFEHLDFEFVSNFEFRASNLQDLSSSNLAYIIYTSGSTGVPKGVMVEHTPVVNLLTALQKEYPFRQSDAYLLKTSYIFDVSVTELFGWFPGGGRLAILEKGGEKDPGKIPDVIRREGITHINFVPSMFHVFVQELTPENIGKLSGLKYIFLAGEALLPGLVEKFRRLNRGIVLENIYGPTESTVYAGRYPLSQWDGKGSIPIGKPLQNTRLYILDRYNHLQPVGVPGELCTAGVGLARGYLNQPELTAEKFILAAKNAKGREGVRRINMSYMSHMSYFYRTGDLARWLPDGNIEFLGRMDHQVKIRGFRIELGEIENGLLNHDHIKEAAVTCRNDESGDKHICAYIVPVNEDVFSKHSSMAGELRNYLSQSLPGYMIPSYFVGLDRIPLTPSGKVDRQALPAPQIVPGENYAAPGDEIEEKLLRIWSEILMIGDASIGVDDSFFHLGGHSLKVTLLVSKIHKELGVKMPVAEVFRRQTIRKLAGYIKESKKEEYTAVEAVEQKEYYPLSSAQNRLFILGQMEGVSTAYNMPLAVRIEGTVDKGLFEKTFRELIRRHESLRTSFHLIHDLPMQKIHKEVEFEILWLEAAEETGGFLRPFDLTAAPLLRLVLIRLEEKKYKMFLDMHHIISDGISMANLVQEFSELYQGKPLAPLRIHYKDYSGWQNKLFASEIFKKQERYWLEEQFSGNIPVLDMPLDFERPGKLTFAGSIVTARIPAQTAEKLVMLARQQDITLNMLFFAVYGVLLSKYSREQEIIIGSLVAGRNHSDLEKVVGMFANFLPVKTIIEPNRPFPEILKTVKGSLLKAYDNQDYPFEKIVGYLQERTDLSRNPLFDTMLMLHNEFDNIVKVNADTGATAGGEIRGLKFISELLAESTSTLDFKLDIYPTAPPGTGAGRGV